MQRLAELNVTFVAADDDADDDESFYDKNDYTLQKGKQLSTLYLHD